MSSNPNLSHSIPECIIRDGRMLREVCQWLQANDVVTMQPAELPEAAFLNKKRILLGPTTTKSVVTLARDCMLLTSERLIKVEGGRLCSLVELRHLHSVGRQFNGAFAWDKVVCRRRNASEETFGVADDTACQWFVDAAQRRVHQIQLEEASRRHQLQLLQQQGDAARRRSVSPQDDSLPAPIPASVVSDPLSDEEHASAASAYPSPHSGASRVVMVNGQPLHVAAAPVSPKSRPGLPPLAMTPPPVGLPQPLEDHSPTALGWWAVPDSLRDPDARWDERFMPTTLGQGGQGWSGLLFAAWAGDTARLAQELEQLREKDLAHPDAGESFLRTALAQTDPFGFTPLCFAAERGQLAAVDLLLRAGSDPNHRTWTYGWTPLLLALWGVRQRQLRLGISVEGTADDDAFSAAGIADAGVWVGSQGSSGGAAGQRRKGSAADDSASDPRKVLLPRTQTERDRDLVSLLLCFGADPGAQMLNSAAAATEVSSASNGADRFGSHASEVANALVRPRGTARRRRSKLLELHNKADADADDSQEAPDVVSAVDPIPAPPAAAKIPAKTRRPAFATAAALAATSGPAQGDWDPLMLAVMAQRLDLVQMLLQAGAEPRLRTRAGNSAAGLVCTYGWPRLAPAAETYCFGQHHVLGGLYLLSGGGSSCSVVSPSTAKQADRASRPAAQLLLEASGLLERLPTVHSRGSAPSSPSSSSSAAAPFAYVYDRRQRERVVHELLWIAQRSGLGSIPRLLGQVPQCVLHGPVLRRLGIRSMLRRHTNLRLEREDELVYLFWNLPSAQREALTRNRPARLRKQAHKQAKLDRKALAGARASSAAGSSSARRPPPPAEFTPSPASSSATVALIEYPRYALQHAGWFEDLRVEDPLAQLFVSQPAAPAANRSRSDRSDERKETTPEDTASTASASSLARSPKETHGSAAANPAAARSPTPVTHAVSFESPETIYDCSDDSDGADDTDGFFGASPRGFRNHLPGAGRSREARRAMEDPELVRNCIVMTRLVFARIENGQLRCCWPLGAIAGARSTAGGVLQWDKLEARFHPAQPSLRGQGPEELPGERSLGYARMTASRRRARLHVYDGASGDPWSPPQQPVLKDTAGLASKKACEFFVRKLGELAQLASVPASVQAVGLSWRKSSPGTPAFLVSKLFVRRHPLPDRRCELPLPRLLRQLERLELLPQLPAGLREFPERHPQLFGLAANPEPEPDYKAATQGISDRSSASATPSAASSGAHLVNVNPRSPAAGEITRALRHATLVWLSQALSHLLETADPIPRHRLLEMLA